jgi:hypothetical integral membrane protein (TIGR02206 family)
MSRLLNPEHLITLGVIVACIAVLVVAARLRPGPWTVSVSRALALLILANEAGWWVWLGFQHTWSASYALPLQLCDVVAFVAAAALWTHRPLLVELAYFWGLAGTTNALISPDLPDHFPSYLFLQYFIAHAGIIAAALLLVIGLRITPRKGALARVVALTLALVLVDAAANAATGGNYMYLRHTPDVPNLLDLMGPWPVYIVWAAALALALFIALDLPFVIQRRAAAAPPALRATQRGGRPEAFPRRTPPESRT